LLGAGQHHDGQQLELGLTSGLPIGQDLLGIGLSATWANAAYRSSYFGVSPVQAANSDLAAYDPGAGWTDRSLTLSFEHRLNPHWRFVLQAYWVWFGSRVTGSPLNLSSRQRVAAASIWQDF
jgi:outer membrane scaffolding protein for murein synthesis (MipA/OmpV family)